MTDKIDTGKEIDRWDWKAWLWVGLCVIAIFATVPLARRAQQFVYETVGSEFFTYAVLFVVALCLVTLLYLFAFKFRVSYVSQYIWLLACAGAYIYFTIQLRQYPEEAVHLIEYGLLSYLLFTALSHRIKDWTVYVTVVFFVLFIGTMDEFIQWLMPNRYWGLKDVWINVLAGIIIQLAIWKGVRPRIISNPVKEISVIMLASMITLNLFFLGLCLSNTPEFVKRYTTDIKGLSWLKGEESMTEYGYKYKDSEIGTFYSRFTIEKLREIDNRSGKTYGEFLLDETNTEKYFESLLNIYTPNANPFFYEFLIHVSRRDMTFDDLNEINDPEMRIEISNTAYRENLILEKYFSNTLKHSGHDWSNHRINDLKKTATLWTEGYSSEAGWMITSFSMKSLWLVISLILTIVWTGAIVWKRRLKH